MMNGKTPKTAPSELEVRRRNRMVVIDRDWIGIPAQAGDPGNSDALVGNCCAAHAGLAMLEEREVCMGWAPAWTCMTKETAASH
jgi:hypothetical protein